MGLHRTLLFLLVVGLIIAAFRRGSETNNSRKTAVPAPVPMAPVSSPAVVTNVGPDGALAASGLEVHK